MLSISSPEWYLVWLDGVLIVVTAVTAGFIAWQAWETRRAANASRDQTQQSQRQADAAAESLRLLREKSDQEESREVVRVQTVLRSMLANVIQWRGITKDSWGMAPPVVRLLPEDWPIVVYQVGRICPTVREKLGFVEEQLARADALIEEFLSRPQNFRDPKLMQQANPLLDEAAAHLGTVVTEFLSKTRNHVF